MTASEAARQREIRNLLEQIQTKELHGSLLVKSLYRALTALRIHSSSLPHVGKPSSNKKNADGTSRAALQTYDSDPPSSSTVEASDDMDPPPNYTPSDQEFFHTVAKDLINLDRVIFSVEEEIHGENSFNIFDYENYCQWYNVAMEMISQVGEGRNISAGTRQSSDLHTPLFDDASPSPGRDNPERWIDRCLDVCGHAISLEVAVDCLRQIVHKSSKSLTFPISSDDYALKRGNKCPGFAAIITSLRTIQRRLILLPTSMLDGTDDFLVNFQEEYQDSLSRLKETIGLQKVCQLCHYITLPLEYHHHKQQSHQQKNRAQFSIPKQMKGIQGDQIFSESLSSLAISALPTLVASSCYAIDLPLPLWATPKTSCGILIYSAWKSLLAGEVLAQSLVSQLDATNYDESVTEQSSTVTKAASDHFQMLVRQLIESGRSGIVIHHLYHCWKYCDTAGSGGASIQHTSTPLHNFHKPRSILCAQLELILASILSKREVAMFIRAAIRYCANQEMLKSEANNILSKHARNHLDEICKSHVLPFLKEALMPSLSEDTGLAEAVVNYVILTPPTSLHCQRERSLQPHHTLHVVDWAVPRCLAQLLAFAWTVDTRTTGRAQPDTAQEDSDSEGSQADSVDDFESGNVFLAQLFTVASVWCEDIFITRTDTLQQQYVTEFLLYPLESKQLTQNDLQEGISDDGTTLATMLVQGVTLRLEVSRSDSIRRDGMLVAEAMASLLGQTLQFEELHRSEHDADCSFDEKGTEVKKERKDGGGTMKNRVQAKPRVLDPDAEYFTDDSDASSSSPSDSSTDSNESDESSDSKSSWGEDSLQPYPMNDDEEDLRRVTRPRTLRVCLAYLLTPDKDEFAYDKHHSALMELASIVASQPLDLLDVVSTLVRILLFLEDKFDMHQFTEKRWDSLMAFGIHAPVETCMLLVGEMRGNISLGNRLDALSIIGAVAQELSGTRSNPQQKALSNACDQGEVAKCSTKLRRVLDLHAAPTDKETKTMTSTQSSKTRRWRKSRSPPTTTTNRFGPVSVQIIYALFAFLSQTRNDESIWGGPIGERFLAEFLKTLSTMIQCACSYPSPTLRVLAADLFDLAWSFHDAKCAEVRYAALLTLATCASKVPIEFLVNRASHGLGSFLNHCCLFDENPDCRMLASLVGGSISEVLSHNMIERA